MFEVDRYLLVGALLLLLGIMSSKLSSRIGLPVLVLFVGVGMLAGSEGLGRIRFEDFRLAHGLATAALALILFDGGLRTSLGALRAVIGPAGALATLGVLVTAAITGVAASRVLGLPLLEGMLLGSIVASTDAAAVFAVLRSSGLNLPSRLAATLEVESGSNDPMAVFLTVGLLEVLRGREALGVGLAALFARQMLLGGVVGLVVGKATVWLANRLDLAATGLYPVITAAAALLAYGLAATIGGSGFLSVYLAGIAIGNGRIVFERAVLLFHDGIAWLSQIGMFVLLGMLSVPSRLAAVAGPALLVTAVLVFAARPAAVVAMLMPFGYNGRELIFVSWAGLKGAVPVVLATYPLMLGLNGGSLIFDVVFFAVLVSAAVQGWTLTPLARTLGLQQPLPPPAPISLEINALRSVDGDIVEYIVTPATHAAGRTVQELALPDGAVLAMIARGDRIIPPRGSTVVEPGDHVFLVVTRTARALADRVFASGPETAPELPAHVEFPLRGDTTVADLEAFYGIRLGDDGDRTLDELLRDRLGEPPVAGCGLTLGPVRLFVRDVAHGRIERVGLVLGDGGDPA
ncbi:MAG: potassium/proton antiporter [Gemmatimonadetes bacterium]|nr:potassium/proton antiporter [Gemmatimonadota bacterium]